MGIRDKIHGWFFSETYAMAFNGHGFYHDLPANSWEEAVALVNNGKARYARLTNNMLGVVRNNYQLGYGESFLTKNPKTGLFEKVQDA